MYDELDQKIEERLSIERKIVEIEQVFKEVDEQFVNYDLEFLCSEMLNEASKNILSNSAKGLVDAVQKDVNDVLNNYKNIMSLKSRLPVNSHINIKESELNLILSDIRAQKDSFFRQGESVKNKISNCNEYLSELRMLMEGKTRQNRILKICFGCVIVLFLCIVAIFILYEKGFLNASISKNEKQIFRMDTKGPFLKYSENDKDKSQSNKKNSVSNEQLTKSDKQYSEVNTKGSTESEIQHPEANTKGSTESDIQHPEAKTKGSTESDIQHPEANTKGSTESEIQHPEANTKGSTESDIQHPEAKTKGSTESDIQHPEANTKGSTESDIQHPEANTKGSTESDIQHLEANTNGSTESDGSQQSKKNNQLEHYKSSSVRSKISLIHQGDIYVTKHQYVKAKECYEEAIKLYRKPSAEKKDTYICNTLAAMLKIASLPGYENELRRAFDFYKMHKSTIRTFAPGSAELVERMLIQ